MSRRITRTMKLLAFCALISLEGMTYANYYDGCCEQNDFYAYEPAAWDDCDDRCSSSCPSFCGCNWWVGAEFIYWKPCIDNLDYVLLEGPNVTLPSGSLFQEWEMQTLCLDWEPGFRINFGADDLWCGWGIGGSYTWLNISKQESVKTLADPVNEFENSLVSPLLIGFKTPSYPYRVVGSYDTSYQTWDVYFNRQVKCWSNQLISPFFGVQGLVFNQKLGMDMFISEDAFIPGRKVRWTSDYHGVGGKIGTDYTFSFSKCFAFEGHIAGAVTVGSADGVNDLVQTDETSLEVIDHHVVKDADVCMFVPGFHLQFALTYNQMVCNWDVSLKLGYEFLQWFNIATPRHFTSDSHPNSGPPQPYTRLSNSNTVNMGFHGLFAGLELKF